MIHLFTMHDAAFNFYRNQAEKINSNYETYSIVEFGSLIIAGNYNGTIRSLFPKASRYYGLDIVPGEGVDSVRDCAEWFPDQKYDIVICAEVLEHASRWPEILLTAHKALNNGGVFLGSCASRDRPPHSAIDGGPLRDGEFYENIAPWKLEFQLLGLWKDYEIFIEDGYFGNDDLYWRAVK